MNDEILVVERLNKKFDELEVLKDINFSLKKGEFLTVLGASGSGKTTLLRILIGLEKKTEGSIFLNGNEISKNKINKRDMGIVFQTHTLFPNMTILMNVMFGLMNNGVSKEESRVKSEEMLKKMKLDDRSEYYPHELSGGQKQRVSIARTLVMNNSIILFDEPLSALDAALKEELKKEIKELQKELGLTIVYITHDQEEAFSLSDKIMILKDGIIHQIDSPKEIYKNPKTKYVKEFLVDQINDKYKRLKKNAGIEI